MGASLSNMHVLVFPLDMDKAHEFISTISALNIVITGASSVMTSAGAMNVSGFARLPFITDEGFETQLQQLVSSQSITHIYTPHAGVWSYMYALKKQNPNVYSFSLCEPSPYHEDWMNAKPSNEWAKLMLKEKFVDHFDNNVAALRKPLLAGQYASLHKQFTSISGQCDELKLLALAHIMRLVPKGDLVEIGSLCGRSAFGIAWLAKQYRIGNLICVDPWSIDKIEGQGDKAAILNTDLSADSGVIDFDKIFSSFITTVSLLDNVGFIRDLSEQAVITYKASSVSGMLSTPELGEVSLCGKISMLHIDGNHRYDFVCKDIAAWEPQVTSGGWILVDDYIWAFGDGPKIAGDELLRTGKFDVAFTMSDTLFLRKR
mgnify:CR=1 FL=1